MGRKVEVVSYRPDWPKIFQAEASALRKIFGDHFLSIHHFGSTAIPGISAKPIIDILLIVDDINQVDPLNAALAKIGYNAVGEYGIPGRRFFYKGVDDNHRSHHLHVYQSGNPHILRHLIFRDYMRTHPMPARAYGRLKEDLAQQYPEDMDSYIAGKNAFVKEHEQIALKWWFDHHHRTDQEQQAGQERQADQPNQVDPEQRAGKMHRVNRGGRVSMQTQIETSKANSRESRKKK